MRKTAKTVQSYLAAVPSKPRAALKRLRATIRAAAPKATEGISYGLPAFFQNGYLVYYAAFRDHCSFFPASYTVIAAHKEELKPFKTFKGTVQFTVEKQMPVGLIRKMVRERVKENEARAKKKKAKR